MARCIKLYGLSVAGSNLHESRALVFRAIEEVKSMVCGEISLDDARVGVGECVNNNFKHRRVDIDESPKIDAEVSADGDSLLVTIYAQSQLRNYPILASCYSQEGVCPDYSETLPEGGMGIWITRSVADVEIRDDGGICLRFSPKCSLPLAG